MSNAPKSILVVTGETSGEEHAARLVQALRNVRPGSYEWFGSGGKEMAEQGVELLAKVDALAAIGPVAACSNLFHYLQLFRQLRTRIRRSPPAVAVLVDFPEFNLRLASTLKRQKIPICYFIGPQIWAWRPGRVRKIRRYVSRMLVILPFEVPFYKRHGVEAIYVGNPIARLSGSRPEPGRPPNSRARIALLPAVAETRSDTSCRFSWRLLPRFNQGIPSCFRVVAAPGVDMTRLQRCCEEWKQKHQREIEVKVVQGPIEEQLPWADCAIVKSGTSTLQAMVLEVPFAMVYRMSELSYRLLRPLVRTQSFCLANLVAGRHVVPEFVQGEAQGKAIATYLIELLSNPERMREVKQNLQNASKKLGTLDAYTETVKQIVSLAEDPRE